MQKRDREKLQNEKKIFFNFLFLLIILTAVLYCAKNEEETDGQPNIFFTYPLIPFQYFISSLSSREKPKISKNSKENLWRSMRGHPQKLRFKSQEKSVRGWWWWWCHAIHKVRNRERETIIIFFCCYCCIYAGNCTLWKWS